MNLRNYLLAGLGLCVFTLAAIAFLNPDFGDLLLRVPAILALMSLVVAWNVYAAIHWTQPTAREDSMILQLGVKWGLAIACAWAVVAIVPINFFSPLWFLGLISALFLPFAAGAAGAIKTGKARTGIRVGFWAGVVGGLLGFLIVMAVGIPSALISSWRVPADPSVWHSERIGVTLVFAIYAMFLFGTILGSIGGTVGGWIGLRLYRTGEPPASAASTIA